MPITGVKGLAIIRYILAQFVLLKAWVRPEFYHHATLGHEPSNPFRRLPARSTRGNCKREKKSDPIE